MPSISNAERKKIIDICKETDCELKTLPGLYQLALGNVTVNSLRKVDVEDLLGREPVKMNSREVRESLCGKTVLVTGGGGSIGSEICLVKKFRVVSTVFADDCIKDLSILDDADTVFLIGVHSNDRNIIAKHCLMNDITAFIIPRIGDLIIAGSKRTHMFHLLLLKVERYNPSFEYMAIKRIGDIILSLIAIVMFFPIILVTAICIKAEDHGPIIYKQCRLTKDGKMFDIYNVFAELFKIELCNNQTKMGAVTP